MSGSANNPLSKVVGRIFPKVPDFIGMMAEQSALAVKSMDALVAYMEYPTPEAAAAVLELEKQGDVLKDRNLDALNQAFSTPMDREDLYRGIVTIDHVMNYAKTTVREMHRLDHGGWLLDTPGMREFQLSDAASGLAEVFDDIVLLALEFCLLDDRVHGRASFQ